MVARIDFEACISPEPNSGCWLWADGGEIVKGGYIRIMSGSRRRLAHRYAYERYRGPIPPGLYVCHHCDVRCCVNPDHLFLGTLADNNADRDRKGRQPRGTDIGLAKLTDADVLEIRASTETQRALGRRYGVAHCTIGLILRHETWTHL
jgi:hypothetical protein